MNEILKLLKAKINQPVFCKSQDVNGNEIIIEDNLISETDLEKFLLLSLSEFNQMVGTRFSYADDLSSFSDILVEGAMLHFLQRQAVLERAKEIMVSDDGIAFTPPDVSSVLQDQWKILLNHHFLKLSEMRSLKEYFVAR